MRDCELLPQGRGARFPRCNWHTLPIVLSAIAYFQRFTTKAHKSIPCASKEKQSGNETQSGQGNTPASINQTEGLLWGASDTGDHQPGRFGHGHERDALLPGRIHDSRRDARSWAIKLYGVKDPKVECR